MDLLAINFWRVWWCLIAAAAVQIALLRARVPLAIIPTWSPQATILAAVTWFIAGAILDSALVHLAPRYDGIKAWLKSLCIGVSIRPFCWELGRASDTRKAGQGLAAFGPLRLWWRYSAEEPAAFYLARIKELQAAHPPFCVEVTAGRFIGRGELVQIKDGVAQ